MQKRICLALALYCCISVHAQHVGVGTKTPQARLHIDSGALLVTGTTGNVPVIGAGTRFMWVPARAALRFGQLDPGSAANWNTDSIGFYSIAAGKNAKARGDSASVALGWNVSAAGQYGSIALGSFSEASGVSAVAAGSGSRAWGNYSTSIGTGDTASGEYSMALGLYSSASGSYSTAIGTSAQSSGSFAIAIGQLSKASGVQSTSIGLRNQSSGASSFTFGFTDTASADFSIAVGVDNKATAPYAKAFGSGVRASGGSSMGVGDQVEAKGYFSQAYGNLSSAQQEGSFVFGNYDTSASPYSFAIGNSSYSVEPYAWAQGNSARAVAIRSFAFGNWAQSTGGYSFSLGNSTTAAGIGAFSIGNYSVAAGHHTVASGLNLSQKSYGGFAAGLFNDTTDAGLTFTTASQNRIFQIGNGTADNARGNALTVLQNGNIGLGVLLPETRLHIRGQDGNNQVILEHTVTGSQIRLSNDGGASGPYIGTVSNHSFSLVSNNAVRAVITSAGQLNVMSSITVQNGKGLIRGIDGVQKKQLTTTVTINTSFTAGQTQTFPIIWPEGFSLAPDAFVGNIVSGAGGWAEVVMSIGNTSTTGATLYVYNPRSVSVSPNFTVKVIAIGAQ